MASFENWNLNEFRRIRNAAEPLLESIAKTDVDRSNGELHAAQSKRKQPVADGYTYTVTHTDRPRVNIYPFTARAIAHDAVHHAIVKNLPMGTPPIPPPNREVPAELGRRSIQAQGGSIGGDS